MYCALSKSLKRLLGAIGISLTARKTRLLTITAILVAAPLNSAGFYQGNLSVTPVLNLGASLQSEAQAIEVNKRCDFSNPVKLRRTNQYGIFGTDEFDTIVCGYLIKKQIEVFGEQQTNAYLKIVAFYDEGFKKSIAAGIQEGNTVNFVENGVYEFNLGCLKKGKIVGDENQEIKNKYIDGRTQAKLLKSSPNQPISLILSFSKHSGRDCCCLNLAEKIRVYE
ncbi:MAG TPA: hypothetical protein V6D11_07555 [Waterburya sp.]|jgi:hypothetical protein